MTSTLESVIGQTQQIVGANAPMRDLVVEAIQGAQEALVLAQAGEDVDWTVVLTDLMAAAECHVLFNRPSHPDLVNACMLTSRLVKAARGTGGNIDPEWPACWGKGTELAGMLPLTPARNGREGA